MKKYDLDTYYDVYEDEDDVYICDDIYELGLTNSDLECGCGKWELNCLDRIDESMKEEVEEDEEVHE